MELRKAIAQVVRVRALDKLRIDPYAPFHYTYVSQWLSARNLAIPPKDEMPEIGVVCYNGAVAVSLGSLRRIEGGFAYLDGLVTNPECLPEVRDKANDMVVSALISKAKDLKIKTIIAYSQDKNTLVRSNKHGFVQLPHVLIAKSLRDEDEIKE